MEKGKRKKEKRHSSSSSDSTGIVFDIQYHGISGREGGKRRV